MGFPGGSEVKNPPAMQEPQEIQVRSLGQEDPLEKGMATHSSVLGWGNPFSLAWETSRGDWRPVVHGVAKSWTRLSN